MADEVSPQAEGNRTLHLRTLRKQWQIVTLQAIATIALVALASFLLEGKGMEESLLKVTFIGLAALTVPHMLLVDLYPRIRTTNS